MKNFALGKYVPYDSWLHRLDPRLKIFTTILLMVAVFLSYPTWAMTFTVAGVLFVIISILLWCTHMSIRQVLSSLASMWFVIIFLLLIYCLMPIANPTLPIAWNWNGWIVYWDAFASAAKIVLRLFLMVELTMILTASTKPLDLTYALEWYMAPLKIFHFPAAEVAMTISIALRFIPTLLEDATRVTKAQSSRGVDFSHGNLFKRIRWLTSLIIPLFVSSFLRSEELANAMECRCYDPQAKRTHYRKLRFHWLDLLSLLLSAALVAGLIYLCASRLDAYALFGVDLK